MNDESTATLNLPYEPELETTVLGAASAITGDAGGGGGDFQNIVWGLF